jgi:phage shock protein A
MVSALNQSTPFNTGAKPMGTFSRMRYVIAANVNALIEKAEDPEKLLRALIREMEDAGEEARLASAEVMAELSHLQRAIKEQALQQQQWRERAEKAVLDNRDDLAREALRTAADVASRQSALGQEELLLKSRSEQLNTDMATLKQKLAEAKLKLRDIQQKSAAGNGAISGSKVGHALPQSRAERRIQRAMSRFDGLQAQVENLEARVASYETGGVSPSVWKSAAAPVDPEVEDALQQLKNRLGTKPSESAASAPGQARSPESADEAAA